MATYTTNLSLIKPAGTDKIRIAQINQNMDTIDAAIGAVGNTSLQTQVTGISDSMSAVEGGIAIVSNNNTHVAITSGQYVYVKNHAMLSEGLYRATQAIATNGTLTLSNVTPESAGGLNSLNEQIANNLPRKIIHETIAISGGANTWNTQNVTFPSAFSTNFPSVVVNSAMSEKKIFFNVTNRSSTGFTLEWYSDVNAYSGAYVMYIAMG